MDINNKSLLLKLKRHLKTHKYNNKNSFMLYSDEATKYISKKNQKKFIGVFTPDKLKNIDENGIYLLNLQSSKDGNGTHFVVLCVFKNFNLYIDTYGLVPDIRLKRLMKKSNKQNYRNNYCFQSFIKQDTTYCGVMSLLLADKLINKKSPEECEKVLLTYGVKLKKLLDKLESGGKVLDQITRTK